MFDRSFYFLRHGETDWNRQGLMQGWIDIPLNETGRTQARTAAGVIAALPVDIIITSPLLRARETADIINAGMSKPILEDPGLRERRFGEMEGTRWHDLLDQYGGLHDDPHALFEGHDAPYCPEGAETYEEFERRVIDTVRARMDAAEGKVPLFVAHGGVCRTLSRVLTGGARRTPNAAPLHFEKSGTGWTLRNLTDETPHESTGS